MKYLLSLSFLLLTAAPFFPAATVTNAAPPPPVATKFLDLFDRLRAAQEKAESGKFQLVTFLLSENEINEYLTYSLKTTPRPGVESISIKAFSNDYISTFTRLDFDALESWRPGTIPTALKPVLKGKKAIWIDFRVHAEDSKLTFTVEKARYDDVPLPAVFVTKMIQIVAARQPEQYDTTRPMPIPFGLRKVWTAEHTIQGRN
jgi:hypothetical protein